MFLRFSFVSASLSDRGGFAICWVMAGRGVASHKPSAGKRQRALALDAGTKGFIGFGYKTKSTGFVGCAVVFDISATPQGGSALICCCIAYEGNRFIRYRSFAHPLAMIPEPPRGFFANN